MNYMHNIASTLIFLLFVLSFVLCFVLFQMSCTFTLAMKAEFPWAFPVPDSPSEVRCQYDNKSINVKSGSKNLRQHEMTKVHQKAYKSRVSQPSIKSALTKVCDDVTMKNKATFYHVLNIVLNHSTLRSSDPTSRKRSLYSVMFPDSKYTKINCGRTKAMYILNHAIAPFARQKLSNTLQENVFGVLVDESTYNNKVRLEIWIIYFDETNHRRLQYLSTENLHVEMDVENFLSSPSSVTLEDLTLVNSEAILKATLNSLEKFNLDLGNLIFLMTDNCNVMTGNRRGFKTLLKEYCPNLMDTTGCVCHTANLLQKDEANSNTIKSIVNFTQCLSNFLDNKPKVKSILQQCENLLNLPRVQDYCPTRFLSLYQVLDDICNQFPLIKKIIFLSKEEQLIRTASSSKFLVQLDQFLIHSAPVFEFTRQMQRGDLTIHDCLQSLLELITKLLARLGRSVQLTPELYFSKLFVASVQMEPIPRKFSSKIAISTSNIQYSKNRECVTDALDQLNDKEIFDIKNEWDEFNAGQLANLLERFSSFLSSEIVHHCYVLFVRIADFTDSCLNRFGLLCEAIGYTRCAVHDEFSRLRLGLDVEDKKQCLSQLFEIGRLNEYLLLKRVCRAILLIIPHNMSVERGFSEMKVSESKFQSQISLETYDNQRFVCGFFDRKTFETIDPPADLLKLMSDASSMYKSISKEKVEKNAVSRWRAAELRQELQVYKRRTPSNVKAEMLAVDKELKKAEEDLEKLRAKKQKLEKERQNHSHREDVISSSIIDKFF